MRRKMWTCDFEGCTEIAQWYRKSKGQIIKVCKKHEARLAKEHWGRRVDYTELDMEDMCRLETKELRSEFDKEHPFDVELSQLDDGRKVRVRDSQTREVRSFMVRSADMERFHENYRNLEKKGFFTKPSVDDYVEKLRSGMSSNNAG